MSGVRPLLFGRRCAGWASRNRSGKCLNGRVQAWGLQAIVPAKGSLNKATEAVGPKREKKEGVHVQGRRDPISQGECQNLRDVHDEAIFMAQ